MDKLMSLLSDIRPDVNFNEETALIDNRVLDSFDIVTIVSEINDQFDIEISVNDLEPENFNSAAAMYELITKLLEG